jgi:SsrA-binding protein
MNKEKGSSGTIALNKQATHEYFIENRYEAGLGLQGWEVKSLRAGRAQLKESYVIVKNGEAWLLGAHISPLPTASTHIQPDPLRTRKLPAPPRGQADRGGRAQGYTLVPLAMYWKHGHIKLEIGLAKGKRPR